MSARVGFASGHSGNRRHPANKSSCSKNCYSLCIQITKWLPVLVIVAIVSWSYYAYIVHLCVLTVVEESGLAPAIVLAVFYHIFFVPFLTSYWQTVWTKPGRVPSAFGLSTSEIDMIETASEPKRALENLIRSNDLVVATRSLQGEVRYCSDCGHIKVHKCCYFKLLIDTFDLYNLFAA